MKKNKLKKLLLTIIPLSLVSVASISTGVLIHKNNTSYNSSSSESNKNINNEKVNGVNNYKYKFDNKIYDSIDDATNDYLSNGNLNREKMIGEFKQVSGSYALNMDDARKYDSSKMSIAYKTVNNEYTKDFNFAQKSYQNARYETKYYDYNGQWFDSYNQASDSIIKNIKPTGMPHYQIKPNKDSNDIVSFNPFNKYDKNRAVMTALESLSNGSKSNFSSGFYYKNNVNNGVKYQLLERDNLYQTLVYETFKAFIETFVDTPFINLDIQLMYDNNHNKYVVHDMYGKKDYVDGSGVEDTSYYDSYKKGDVTRSELNDVFKYKPDDKNENNYFNYLRKNIKVINNVVTIPGLTLNMLFNKESPWRNLTNRKSISSAWDKQKKGFSTYKWLTYKSGSAVSEEMEFNLFGHRIYFNYVGNCEGGWPGTQLRILEDGGDHIRIGGIWHDTNKSADFKHTISVYNNIDYIKKSFTKMFKDKLKQNIDNIKEKNNFLKWETIEKSIYDEIEKNLFLIVNYILDNKHKFINKSALTTDSTKDDTFYKSDNRLSSDEKNVSKNLDKNIITNNKIDIENIWNDYLKVFLPMSNVSDDSFLTSPKINQYFNNINNSFVQLFKDNGLNIDNSVELENNNNKTPIFVVFYNNAPLFEFNLNKYNDEWKKIDKNIFSNLNKNDLFYYLNNLNKSNKIVFKNLLKYSNILDSFVNVSNNVISDYKFDQNKVHSFVIKNNSVFEINVSNNIFINYNNSSSDFSLALDNSSSLMNYDFKNLLYFYNENNKILKIKSDDLIVFRTDNSTNINSIGSPINLYYAEFLSNGIDYDKSIESLPIYKTFDELEKAKISKNNLKPLDVICLKDNNNMIINDDIFNENGTLNKENYDMYNPLDLIRSNIARTYAIKNSKDYVYYQDGNNEILLKNNISNLYKLYLNKNNYYFYNFLDAKTFLYEYIKINSEII